VASVAIAAVGEAADASAEAAADALAGAPAPAAVDEHPLSPEEQLERKRMEFWRRQDELTCWQVPFGLHRGKMGWLVDGETGFDVAIARARALGKTPLLVDTSYEKIVQGHLDTLDGVIELKAFDEMFEAERSGSKTHKQVMNDARSKLVAAMREGKTLHIRLDNKVVDFTGDQYCNSKSFPFSIFDQRVVNDLLDNYTASAPIPPGLDSATWHGLAGAIDRHPYASVLGDADLDHANHFFVKQGFNVIVSTHLKVDEYESYLRNAMPLKRLQGINPLPSPV